MVMTELLDQKIKGVYLKEYPWDPLGEEIIETVIFRDVVEALNAGQDVYQVFGVGDSIIREHIFSLLSKMLMIDYDIFYYTWLYQKYILGFDGSYTENAEFIDPETTPEVQKLRAFQANPNSRTDVPERFCPICKKAYQWEPDILAKDGVTEICPRCGFIQMVALELMEDEDSD